MFSFFRKKPSGPVVLTVEFEGEPVWSVREDEVPAKLERALELRQTRPLLSFVDSAGQRTTHELGSAHSEGQSWLHLNVRVSERFALEADGLLSASSDTQRARQEFASHGPAIRFQPLYLPQCPADPADLVGKGFFFRGLQFQGTISPSNVSMGCICDVCRGSFRASCFHAGFSELQYFFCDRGPHTLAVSSYVDGVPPLLEYVQPETVAPFEAMLPPCRCGGSFAYLNPFRCPHCGAAYIDFRTFPLLRAVEYYGCTLYGDSPQRWEPEPAG